MLASSLPPPNFAKYLHPLTRKTEKVLQMSKRNKTLTLFFNHFILAVLLANWDHLYVSEQITFSETFIAFYFESLSTHFDTFLLFFLFLTCSCALFLIMVLIN